nr:Crp/Fnr family transcriptional regulator [Pedobacter sp. ASV2]
MFGGRSPVISFLQQFHPLNTQIEEILNEQTFPITFAKGRHLASPLQCNRFLFLILKGSVCSYVKYGKQRITTWIAIENEIVGSIRNLWTDELSEEYVETLEPVLAIAIPHIMSLYLYETFPIANYVGRKLIEIHYCGASERAFIGRLPTTRKRYERFLVTYNHLLDRIPQKHIASFLAMRVETLCRIRQKLGPAH